jgi:hypothetical protein
LLLVLLILFVLRFILVTLLVRLFVLLFILLVVAAVLPLFLTPLQSSSSFVLRFQGLSYFNSSGGGPA